MDKFKATTIVAVKRKGNLAIAGDGQVTFGENMIMKNRAKKVRTLYDGKILAGFAGASADAFTLFERFEQKLEEYHGQIVRAAVELGKQWRTDRMLRNLEALLIVGNAEHLLVISGTGDIIEPDEDIIAIGSGGAYALASAKALMKHSSLTVSEIARESLEIAASICVYTNHNITVLEIGNDEEGRNGINSTSNS